MNLFGALATIVGIILNAINVVDNLELMNNSQLSNSVEERKACLNVFASKNIPYTYFDEKKGFYKGLDFQLLDVICDKLNLKMCITATETHKLFENNFTFDGVDVVIGGLNEHLNQPNFVKSVSYYEDDITWCVKRAKPIPIWLHIFRITKGYDLWIIATFLIFAVPAVIYLNIGFEHRKKDIWGTNLLVMATFLSFSITYDPKLNLSRLIFGYFLLTDILVLGTFNAFLFRALFNPQYHKQISSVDEIIQNDFQMASDKYISQKILNQNMIPLEKLKPFDICQNASVCFDRLSEIRDDIAVAVSRQHATFMLPETNLFCFDKKEHIYGYTVSFLLRKNLRLLPEINELIQRIMEAGLLNKWTNDYRFKEKFAFDELKIEVLRVGHIIGALLGCAVFLICTTFVFFMERIIYKKINENPCHPYWVLASHIVDGDRHYFHFR